MGAEKTRYLGKKLTVCTVAGRCIHSRHCVLDRADVFIPNVEGDWVKPDAAPVADVIATVTKCPSGALQYESNDPSVPAEQPPAVNSIRVMENGPYVVHAQLDVAGDTSSYRATLCRCGHSKNKPYCDKSHEAVGFEATGQPPSRDSEPLAVRNGPLTIRPLKKGPLLVTGSVEICAASGKTLDRVTGTRLCRCGKSQDKPFCDGSHARTGFTDVPAAHHGVHKPLVTPGQHEGKAESFVEGFLAQYDSQIALLKSAGLLEGNEMTDIHGKKIPVPTREEIRTRIETAQPFLEKKFHQGFTRLLVVPMGAPLTAFENGYAGLLKKHVERGTLHDSAGNSIDALGTDNDEIFSWDGLNKSDENGLMNYFPPHFSDSPREDGAKTKTELPPFMVVVTEYMPNVPLKSFGAVLGVNDNDRRRQLEAGSSPESYLETIADSKRQYVGEIGFTPEIALVDAMTHVEETGGVSNDTTAAILIGSYLVGGRLVPTMKWQLDGNRVVLGAIEPETRDHTYGPRVALVI